MRSCSRSGAVRVTWLALLAVTFACLAGCTSAPTADEGQISGERLVAVTPTAWKRIYQINTDKIRISDFVPPEQDAANWTTRISFEAHATTDLLTDPIALLLAEAAEDEKKCAFLQQFNIFSGYENGFETSVRLFLCGNNEFAGRGEIKLVKTIRGEDYYYFVRISERVPPFEPGDPGFAGETMADWSQFLRSVYVCDDSPDHPCSEPVQDYES